LKETLTEAKLTMASVGRATIILNSLFVRSRLNNSGASISAADGGSEAYMSPVKILKHIKGRDHYTDEIRSSSE
jgi:hypothetical protein